jgi:diguanylate cyclase (GGDEF)-like protein
VRSRILIVDDEPINLRVLANLFRHKHDVVVATSGERALALAKTNPPDLVLLDALLPGLDGFDVCRKLKSDETTARAAVIFVTAHNDPSLETKALELGAVDFITKPINPPVVMARANTHLLLKHQTDQLRRLSNVDGLTGIANRRYFDEFLHKEWRRAVRSNTPISVVMCDVDHFKLYNDHYGHLMGDDCLTRLATAMQANVRRPADLVARYGGEEFVVVLPETDLPGARDRAETIRQAVSDLNMPHEASSVGDHVTLSLGAATAYPRPGHRPLELSKLADDLLYKSKESGRNRVHSQRCDW